MALEGKKPVEQITLLRELQAKMLRHSRTMTLDKQDLSWVLQHLSKFTISVKQEVMSLLAHLTVSQPWLKLWLSEPQQLHPLQVQIQQFCENKFHDSRLWNNFLKMLTTCAVKRCVYLHMHVKNIEYLFVERKKRMERWMTEKNLKKRKML